jgi:hypothetical protein
MSTRPPVPSLGLTVAAGADLAVSTVIAMVGWRRDDDLLTVLGVLFGLMGVIALWAMLHCRNDARGAP